MNTQNVIPIILFPIIICSGTILIIGLIKQGLETHYTILAVIGLALLMYGSFDTYKNAVKRCLKKEQVSP